MFACAASALGGPAGTVGTARAAGPLTGVKVVESGSRHACAVLPNGQARCWGDNAFGQLGDGTTTSRSIPVAVLATPGGPALTAISSITAGDGHTCARLISGQVRCWGDNAFGQLGDGTTTDRSIPVAVRRAPGGTPLAGIATVSAGDGHTCAQLSSGQARCWGDNFAGQLGDGTTTDRSIPVAVLTAPGGARLTGVARITTGFWHTCVRLSTAELRCWGDNEFGPLGDGTNADRSIPVAVLSTSGGAALAGATHIISGSWHTCAIMPGRQAVCWGDDGFGQLGDGNSVDSPIPVAVLSAPGSGALTGISSMAGGGNHTCARLTNGQARCWGRNFAGQLGDGTSTNRAIAAPVLIAPGGAALPGVASVTAGSRFTCARVAGGQARCWGFNGEGELGDGTTTNRLTPVVVQT